MALIVFQGDITNAHQIDGLGVENLATDCHTIRRISGHEGISIWECQRTAVDGIEIRVHVMASLGTFAHEALSRYEKRLRDRARMERDRDATVVMTIEAVWA